VSAPRIDTDAFALGAARFEDILSVRNFMREKVRPVLTGFSNASNESEATVYGTFLRGHAWLDTMAELKHPQHFQAAIAGTRALFEICIDLALLHHDRLNYPPSKIVAWERSAKLKAAERTKRCFEGRPLPDEHIERVAFADREGNSIRALRSNTWPGRTKPESHPDRWTTRSLEDDAKAVDGFGNYGMRDYYDGRFAELCWSTHGSGLAGVRFIPEEHFPALIAIAFNDSADLGTLIARFALQYFGKLDAILEARFAELAAERKKWGAIAFAKAKGRI
jgi:hypothetical protein